MRPCSTFDLVQHLTPITKGTKDQIPESAECVIDVSNTAKRSNVRKAAWTPAIEQFYGRIVHSTELAVGANLYIQLAAPSHAELTLGELR